MVHYRRNKTRGATYFFTVTLKNRKSDLLIKNITLLRRSICRAKKSNFSSSSQQKQRGQALNFELLN